MLSSTAKLTPDSLDCEKTPGRTRLRHCLVHLAQQLESELWAARLGFCGEEWQLDVIPGCAEGTPNQSDYHPSRFF